MALRFGDSTIRRDLLSGLLDYRAALHAAGLLEGFQWIDGSFVEDTTFHSGREPGDIDVVTFFRLPAEQDQSALIDANPAIFDSKANKLLYGVDAYTVVLDTGDLPYLVRLTAYWNSLWSHDRNHKWKGFLEINLSDSDDAAARAMLNESAAREGKV